MVEGKQEFKGYGREGGGWSVGGFEMGRTTHIHISGRTGRQNTLAGCVKYRMRKAQPIFGPTLTKSVCFKYIYKQNATHKKTNASLSYKPSSYTPKTTYTHQTISHNFRLPSSNTVIPSRSDLKSVKVKLVCFLDLFLTPPTKKEKSYSSHCDC